MKTLDDVRSRARELAVRLDPSSRYITDLTALIDASRSVDDLVRRMDDGCRGQRHAGADVFRTMSLDEKLLANLITPETTLFRFSEGELEAIDRHLLPQLTGEASVLVVPCSHGEEAFTIAAYFSKVGVDFSIRAFDVQPALVEEAKTGRLTFGYPIEFLATPGVVSSAILSKITFAVGDAFDLPLEDETFHLILCRNFVGYFVEEEAIALVIALLQRVRPGGVLFLDGFALAKFPNMLAALEARGARQLFGRPAFSR